MQITLHQFETIDGLFRSCLARPALEDVIAHPLASADYIRTIFYRPEWKLLDACVEATSLSFVDDFASTIDCAAHILTHALTGAFDVIDLEAA